MGAKRKCAFLVSRRLVRRSGTNGCHPGTLAHVVVDAVRNLAVGMTPTTWRNLRDELLMLA